jgi:DNA polymerase-3 subunit delta'
MPFESVVGQHRVKAFLAASLEKGRLVHAVLFHGPLGIGKDAMALAMAMGLNCLQGKSGGCGTCPACSRILRLEGPGFHFIQPVPSKPKAMKDEKYAEILRERALARVSQPYRTVSFAPELSTLPVIGIDAIRSIKQETRLKLAGAGTRVFLISQADQMTVPAANSMLKLLEEPPEDTAFFLTSAKPARILPTILSRCQQVRFDMLRAEDIEEALTLRWELSPEQARFFARLSGGSLQKSLELSEGGYNEKREAALAILDFMFERRLPTALDSLDTILKGSDKSQVRDVLGTLLVLLRDLSSIRLQAGDRILNFDCVERLAEFERTHPEADLDRAAMNVTQAIDFIEKNVYLPLILTSLNPQFGSV